MDSKAKVGANAKLVSVLITIGMLLTMLLFAEVVYVLCNMEAGDLNERFFYLPYTGRKDLSIARCCSAALQYLVFFAVQFIAFKIFKDISKGGSPFEQVHVVRIRTIGIMIVVLGILCNPISSLFAKLVWPGIIKYGIILDPNILLLFMGIFVWCLSAVFSYGCMLQRESDETL